MTLRLLPALLLSACAACQHPPVAGPVPVDPLPTIIAALTSAGPTAEAYRDLHASTGREGACAAWGSVAIAAPVLADTLRQVAAGEPLDHFPAVTGSIAACDLPEIQVPVQVEVITAHVVTGLSTVQFLVAVYAPQLQADHCRAYAVASGAVDYAAVLAPAVVAGLSTWALDVAAVPVDYSACPVEAVAPAVEVAP